MANEALTLGLGLEVLPESLQKLHQKINTSLQESSKKFNQNLFTDVKVPSFDNFVPEYAQDQNLASIKLPEFENMAQPVNANSNEKSIPIELSLIKISKVLERIDKKISQKNTRQNMLMHGINKNKLKNIKNDNIVMHGMGQEMGLLGNKVDKTLQKASGGLKKGIAADIPFIGGLLSKLSNPLVAAGAAFVGVIASGIHFARADAEGAASLIRIQRGFSLDMFKMMQGLMPGIRKMLQGVSQVINSPILGKIMGILGDVVGNVLGFIVDRIEFIFKLMTVGFRSLHGIVSPLKPFFNGIMMIMEHISNLILKMQDFFLWVAGSKHTVVGMELGGSLGKVMDDALNKATGGIFGKVGHFLDKIIPSANHDKSNLSDVNSRNIFQVFHSQPAHAMAHNTHHVTNHYHGDKSININIKGNVDKKNVNTLANQISQHMQSLP